MGWTCEARGVRLSRAGMLFRAVLFLPVEPLLLEACKHVTPHILASEGRDAADMF